MKYTEVVNRRQVYTFSCTTCTTANLVKQSSAQEPTFIHVRFTHIARQFPPGESEKKDKFLDRVTEILKPFTIDKGWYLELTGEEGDRSLLRVQGMRIPPPGSEDEKKWVAENAAVPYGPYLSRM